MFACEWQVSYSNVGSFLALIFALWAITLLLVLSTNTTTTHVGVLYKVVQIIRITYYNQKFIIPLQFRGTLAKLELCPTVCNYLQQVMY